ncbi:uncharacterized protein LOC133510966 isoform X2 [Syngnathoides biaculeatus]|uniref:uncharacterized protein LOC133510966 isoform X2 n=1 Tax=Syngnathoides biaculeatus TaxID=300417 RepID=UPI002ADE1585|nr:uncharacterized protein LOC133510966 isoform X2 [Syngnathoides biaculeatus]
MMWVIVNYWRSKRHWRNGDTGWRDHKCHLWSLRTIRGLNNGKLDTLSQIHEGERTDSVSVPTLLEACFVSGFTWEIKTWLKKALRDSPGPTECPPGHLFVVPSLRGDGWVEYAHNSLPSSSTVVRCCKQTWEIARKTLIRMAAPTNSWWTSREEGHQRSRWNNVYGCPQRIFYCGWSHASQLSDAKPRPSPGKGLKWRWHNLCLDVDPTPGNHRYLEIRLEGSNNVRFTKQTFIKQDKKSKQRHQFKFDSSRGERRGTVSNNSPLHSLIIHSSGPLFSFKTPLINMDVTKRRWQAKNSWKQSVLVCSCVCMCVEHC